LRVFWPRKASADSTKNLPVDYLAHLLVSPVVDTDSRSLIARKRRALVRQHGRQASRVVHAASGAFIVARRWSRLTGRVTASACREHCATQLARPFDPIWLASCAPDTHAGQARGLACCTDAAAWSRRTAVLAARPRRVSTLFGAEGVVRQQPTTIRPSADPPTVAIYERAFDPRSTKPLRLLRWPRSIPCAGAVRGPRDCAEALGRTVRLA
jgi:hypothetical protein